MSNLGAQNRPSILTEQTAKKYKFYQLIGVLILLLSIALSFLGLSVGIDWVTYFAGVGGILGVAVYGTGRFLSWWHHG